MLTAKSADALACPSTPTELVASAVTTDSFGTAIPSAYYLAASSGLSCMLIEWEHRRSNLHLAHLFMPGLYAFLEGQREQMVSQRSSRCFPGDRSGSPCSRSASLLPTVPPSCTHPQSASSSFYSSVEYRGCAARAAMRWRRCPASSHTDQLNSQMRRRASGNFVD